MAFGRVQGAISAVLYWVTNPLWVGGSRAFIATEAWNDNISHISGGSFWGYLFKLLFIWFSIGVAIASLRRGKWIPNFGAYMRVFVLGFFTITVIVYAFKHGVHGFPVSDLKPTGTIFFALVPLVLFNYVGFELQNGARPYGVPGGPAGMWIACGLIIFWTALGSWVAVFPGTLEKLFGIAYDFHGTWGVSRGTFATLTLGTLAVILLIALVGYWTGRDVRRDAVEVAIATRAQEEELART
jgi:hypothetical protein